MSKPKQGTQRITIETLRSGQPRAYADHVYEWVITFERVGWTKDADDFQPWQRTVPEAQRIAKALLGFKVKEDRPEWHETILQSIDELEPGKFRVIAGRAYTG